MKWKDKASLKSTGNRRIIKRFAWIPTSIAGVWVWLEYYKVVQIYNMGWWNDFEYHTL